MSRNATPSKNSSRAVFEEPIFVRYSPHHEFPLSTVSSFALHALVIGLLIIAGIVIARLNLGGEMRPIPADAVAMEPGGGGGNPNGVGKGLGDGAVGDPDAPDAPPPDPNQPIEIDPARREKLQEVRKEALALPEFKDEEGKRLIEEGGQQVDKILRLKSDVRGKLNKGLAAGQGGGGSGRGGGTGTGTGTGSGAGVGPGTGTVDDRIKRPMRWTLLFSTRDGNDYKAQLKAFGAILAVPDPRNPDNYLVIRDLDQKPVQPQAEDISQIKRIYWIDDKPASVRSLATALGIPPPPHFVVFFPQEFEEELLGLELKYRGKQENQIAETRFEVVRGHGGRAYDPRVVSQR